VENTQRISPATLNALKAALSKVYWYKPDLKSFIRNSCHDTKILNLADWGELKIKIVSDIVDGLASNQPVNLEIILNLIRDVSQIEDFSHLKKLDDGEKKAREAIIAVESLRRQIQSHDTVIRDREASEQRRKTSLEHLNKVTSISQRLDDLRKRYAALLSSKNPQSRGIELEKVMYDVFDLFDLDPKASFNIVGEQIDGAFSLDGTEYIFEAKWHQGSVSRADMDAFSMKVTRKLGNTLGLFLSINSFSPEGVQCYSNNSSKIFLMTGADLNAVLEERIDFRSMIQRKKRHASATGTILFEVHQFID
jgi:Restriction endonuclease